MPPPLPVPPPAVPVLEGMPRVPLPAALDPVGPESLHGLLRLADDIELGIAQLAMLWLNAIKLDPKCAAAKPRAKASRAKGAR